MVTAVVARTQSSDGAIHEGRITRVPPMLSTPSHQVDIAVLIPKMDELKGLAVAFALDMSHSDQIQSRPFYRHTINGMSVGILVMNEQGTGAAVQAAEIAVRELNPVLLFMVGTAAGRQDKVNIGSVVVSDLLISTEENRLVPKGKSRRPKHFQPPRNLLNEIQLFFSVNLDSSHFVRQLLRAVEDLSLSPSLDSLLQPPHTPIVTGAIASSTDLVLDPEALQEFWGIDDRIRCVDMESGGFGQSAVESDVPAWIVFRGVSDFGTEETKSNDNRVAASAAAGLFLKEFLQHGLNLCHPARLRLSESPSGELSKDQFYTRYDSLKFVKEAVKRKLSLDLSEIDLGRLTLANLVSVCTARGTESNKAMSVLQDIREEYFTQKYLDYSYELDDLRGLVPNWHSEVHEVMQRASFSPEGSRIVDVGVGNGLELQPLFGDLDYKELVGVDISKAMLEKASGSMGRLTTHHASAEDLGDLESSAFDLYISLRTYMSRFFDMRASVAEAQRVLKKGGRVIISIANGYVGSVEGDKRVVRGLLVPGSKRRVDKEEPRRLALELLGLMDDFGFENTGHLSDKTDIYVWGVRP